MERAPLRPVPTRPAGPVDPVAATSQVAALLPALSPLEIRAFALVALAGRPRAEAASSLGVDEAALGPMLAWGRKELRRTIAPLGGSGWCERAEGLISDRLDGPLGEPDAQRLDVHLRNCPRCVEHERRLVQATDALLAGLAGPPRLGLAAAPDTEPVIEQEPEPPAAPPLEVLAPGTDDWPETPAMPEVAAAEGHAYAPSPAPPSEAEIAAAAEVLVAARTRGQIAAALTWNAMIAIAMILALAAIALTVAGVVGAEL